MSDLGNLGQVFSSIGPALNTGITDLTQGAQQLFSGSGLDAALGGLFGGGSSAVTGAIAPDVTNLSAVTNPMAQIGANIGDAAGGVGQAASSIMAGPGAMAADPSAMASVVPDITQATPGISNVTGAAFGDPSMGISATATGAPTVDPVTGVTNTAMAGAPGGILPGSTSITPSFLQNLQTQGGSFLQNLMKNPNALKMLGEGGLLGAELLNANRTPPGEGAIKALAAQQGAFAKNQGELATAEQQGMLPAGATQMFQGMMNANLAAVRAKYAQMGMTGSTAEMEDLQNVRDATMAQMFQQGQQMAQQGWTNVNQATGYQSQLLDEILASETAQGTQLGQALAAFAGAAAK